MGGRGSGRCSLRAWAAGVVLVCLAVGGLLVTSPPAGASGPVVVTTTADGVAVNGNCTLREAIQTVSTGADTDQCVAGSNEIVLPAGFLFLQSPLDVGTSMTIGGTAPGTGGLAGTQILGQTGFLGTQHLHAIQVGAGATVTLDTLAVSGSSGAAVSLAQDAGTLTLRQLTEGFGGGRLVEGVNSSVKVYDSDFNSGFSGSGRDNYISTGAGPITVAHSRVYGLRTVSGAIDVDGSTVRNPIVSNSGVIDLDSVTMTGTATVSGAATATNSIVACTGGGPFTSGGHNLTDGTCGFAAVGDVVGASGVPASGGPPPPGSLAIDAGGSCSAVDQRGVERPVDGDGDGSTICDIGAFEALPRFHVTGDWDGDGTATQGTVEGSVWRLRNTHGNGPADLTFDLGQLGVPVVGDWDGDGTDTIGVVNGRTWHLRNSNTAGPADATFTYGSSGGLPVSGDWNGDGTDTVGLVKGRTWFLRNSNGSGPADVTFTFGGADPGLPVSGDWNGDGTDTPGLRKGSTWLLRNGNGAGPADVTFNYGASDSRPVTGDWNGDGTDTIGVVGGSSWFLRNTNGGGAADLTFNYGSGVAATY